MEYNDFCEKYDAKTFENLAKEYAKSCQNRVKSLSLDNNKLENFIKKFESLLEKLFDYCLIFGKNNMKISEKNACKTIEKITQNLCKIYLKIKGEFFFSASKCNVKKDIKKSQQKDEILSVIKEIFLSDFFDIKFEEKEVFFDEIFELIKHIILSEK